jgi:GntR family transcriptional regulator/MocR family aminotransferase
MIPPITLDNHAPTPLYQQLYDGLREAILRGQIRAGTRLPATRTLAAELLVSRNTVVNAFDQLLAEGYLEGRVGDGTYVSRALPEEVLQVRAHAPAAPQLRGNRALSKRGALLATTPVRVPRRGGARAFRHGLVALDAFPYEEWARLTARMWRAPPPELLGYSDPAGYRPLREAIAAYLGAARGVRCTAEQVVITAGSQQALDLAARILLDPGDAVWMEDPGYLGAKGVLHSAGARLVPVRVDHEGLSIAEGAARCPEARAAYVTPSHQYPLGVTMSLARRLALLEWAKNSSAWILEDDYDSEYRYVGRPLAALQGLDQAGRVIYIGTFSKVLLPALRLGYMIVPPDLVDAFVNARALSDRHAPGIEQAVVAECITSGQFGRHIRQMRTLYAERQAALAEAARHALGGLLDIAPAEAGMHLVGWLTDGMDDRAASIQAAEHGIEALPLSAYAMEPMARGGLLLGYTSVDVPEIRAGVRQLAHALHGMHKEKRAAPSQEGSYDN